LATESDLQKCLESNLSASGYIKLKNEKMFLKLVNGEILQFVSYYKVRTYRKGVCEFGISAGVSTIYRPSIDADILSRCEMSIKLLASRLNLPFDEPLYRLRIGGDSNVKALSSAVRNVSRFICKIFKSVTNLNEFVEFKKKTDVSSLTLRNDFPGDSLALIKSGNSDDFLNVYDDVIHSLRKSGICDCDNYGLICKNLYRETVEMTAGARDAVRSDPEKYSAAIDECERRRRENLALLKKYNVVCPEEG